MSAVRFIASYLGYSRCVRDSAQRDGGDKTRPVSVPAVVRPLVTPVRLGGGRMGGGLEGREGTGIKYLSVLPS